ncbi:MAG TPA: glutamate--tRNA ligase, partial [Vicinamibacteria bacterium]|nr:glutamate--tRNA ligase [Vicinamibacteria bacterium]
AIWKLEELRGFTSESIENVFRGLAERLDIPLRDLSRPFYVAVTGAKASTPLFQSMEVLGLDMVRVRLRRAIESLGGISSKRMKALERSMRRRMAS